MRGLLLSALVTAGIVTWRDLSSDKMLPMPSDYVAVALFYGGLALFPASASQFTSLMGWGMTLAVFLNLYDPKNPTKLIYPGQSKQVTPASAGAGGTGGITNATLAPAGGGMVATLGPAGPQFGTPANPVKAQ